MATVGTALWPGAGVYPELLLLNPGFEVDTSGWSPTNATLARVTSEHVVGIASGQITATAAAPNIATFNVVAFPVQGRRFTLSFWVKGSGTGIGKAFAAQINEAGGAISDEATAYTDIVVTSNWQKLIVTGSVIRSDRTTVYLILHSPNGQTGNVFYVDDIQFTGTDVPYPGQGSVPFVRALVSFDAKSTVCPVYTDKTSKLLTWSTQSGRSSELEDFDAGTLDATFDNRDRSLDPIVNSLVRPMNRIWLYSEFSGEIHDLFKGYAEQWQQSWPAPGTSNAITTLRAVDEMKVLTTSKLPGTTSDPDLSSTIPGGPFAPPGTEPGEQIKFILDKASSGSPNTAPRRIGLSGVTLMYLSDRESRGQSPKSEIDLTVMVTSGDAAFFCSSSGELVYLGKTHRASSPYNTVQATFDDDGTDLPYLDLETDYSDTFLFNVWIVTPIGGTSAVAQDSTSIAAYGIRSRSIDNLPIETVF